MFPSTEMGEAAGEQVWGAEGQEGVAMWSLRCLLNIRVEEAIGYKSDESESSGVKIYIWESVEHIPHLKSRDC